MKVTINNYINIIIDALIVFLLANILLIKNISFLCIICLFLFINIKPLVSTKNIILKRHKVLINGVVLLVVFLVSLFGSVIYMLINPINQQWFMNLLVIIIILAITFFNGIIRVYFNSKQLGIKGKVIGIVCGMIPILNVFVLTKIIKISYQEVIFENNKELLNQKRKLDAVCKTKYPILLVHGVFFRDYRYFNYWGRIPDELIRNGAIIYYGNQQSAASIEDSGKELAKRIEEIVKETGCKKINIIAHSKGGLDSRYAISKLGIDKYVASLTTINTPHRGCIFADYLLNKISVSIKEKVANTYNSAMLKLGDKNPDFLLAVNDLTASSAKKFNDEIKDSDLVYYQSVGSKLNKASNGQFPLNFSHYLVKYFDGDNDGLVAESSFQWGSNYQFLVNNGDRGISHGDMIDLNRENISGFDVLEFYVKIVSDLKDKGF